VLSEPKIQNWYRDSNCESLYCSVLPKYVSSCLLFGGFQKRHATDYPVAECSERPAKSVRNLKEQHRSEKKIKRATTQNSVKKICQYLQISGVQNAVGRARAGMEEVGALTSVPSDSVKL